MSSRRQEEPDLHTLVPTAEYAYWIAADRWEWSDEMFALHGFRPGDVVPTTDLLLSHKHADDVESVAEVFADAVRTGESYVCRHRIVDASRRVHTVVAFGYVESDIAGRPAVVRGMIADVTVPLEAEIRAASGAAVRGATATRSVIDQAKGYLMGVYGLQPDEAFGVLRACSNELNTKLHEVAEAVMRHQMNRAHLDAGPEAAVREVTAALGPQAGEGPPPPHDG